MKLNLMSGALWNGCLILMTVDCLQRRTSCFSFEPSEGKRMSRVLDLLLLQVFEESDAVPRDPGLDIRAAFSFVVANKRLFVVRVGFSAKKAIDKSANYFRLQGNSLQVSPDL